MKLSVLLFAAAISFSEPALSQNDKKCQAVVNKELELYVKNIGIDVDSAETTVKQTPVKGGGIGTSTTYFDRNGSVILSFNTGTADSRDTQTITSSSRAGKLSTIYLKKCEITSVSIRELQGDKQSTLTPLLCANYAAIRDQLKDLPSRTPIDSVRKELCEGRGGKFSKTFFKKTPKCMCADGHRLKFGLEDPDFYVGGGIIDDHYYSFHPVRVDLHVCKDANATGSRLEKAAVLGFQAMASFMDEKLNGWSNLKFFNGEDATYEHLCQDYASAWELANLRLSLKTMKETRAYKNRFDAARRTDSEMGISSYEEIEFETPCEDEELESKIRRVEAELRKVDLDRMKTDMMGSMKAF